MKIAIPILHYNKEGGIERHTWEMVKRWSKEHEVHIFANTWKKTEQHIIFHKVPVFKKPKLFSTPSFVIRNSLILKGVDFDIVWNNGCGATFIQDVITAGSLHKAWAKESTKAGLKRFFLNPLHYWTFTIEGFNYHRRRYKKIIAISELIKRFLISYYNIPKDDIVVIHHGVSLEEFYPFKNPISRNNIRRSLRISNQDLLLIFVGKEFRRKGLQYVFEALRILSNERVKLLVIGEGEIKTFKNLACKLNIADRVFFLGYLSNVSEYYKASDIFIFPSTFDAFGMVVLEAMATGLPVIVSTTTGASELIHDGEDGMLLNNFKNYREIAYKINLLRENILLRQNIGLKATKKAEQHSWDVVAKETLKVFKEISI